MKLKTIFLSAVLATGVNVAQAFDMGDMMDPGEWFGNNDRDYYDRGYYGGYGPYGYGGPYGGWGGPGWGGYGPYGYGWPGYGYGYGAPGYGAAQTKEAPPPPLPQ